MVCVYVSVCIDKHMEISLSLQKHQSFSSLFTTTLLRNSNKCMPQKSFSVPSYSLESKTSSVPTISLYRCITRNAGSEGKVPKKQTKSERVILQTDSAELRFLSAMPTFVLDIQAPIRHQGSLVCTYMYGTI